MKHAINKEAIEVLNDLVVINNDRIAGYEKAIEETKDTGSLKATFSRMIIQSRQNVDELTEQLKQHGEDADTGTTLSGKVYRVWMDVKSSVQANKVQSALELCEFGEDAAQAAYRTALKHDDLPEDIYELIEAQQEKLEYSHDEIKALRDAKKNTL